MAAFTRLCTAGAALSQSVAHLLGEFWGVREHFESDSSESTLLRQIRLVLAIITLPVLICACAQTEYPQGVPIDVAAANSGAAFGMSQNANYNLASGDRLRVIVFGEEQLSGEYTVSGSGLVSLPLIGEVRAMGLSVLNLQETIRQRLADGYVMEPRVSIELLSLRPFYVLGEVNKPGEYPFTAGMTALNAVARAEGFTYRATKKWVYIRRSGDTRELKVRLTATTPVFPGDTIRVGERNF